MYVYIYISIHHAFFIVLCMMFSADKGLKKMIKWSIRSLIFPGYFTGWHQKFLFLLLLLLLLLLLFLLLLLLIIISCLLLYITSHHFSD